MYIAYIPFLIISPAVLPYKLRVHIFNFPYDRVFTLISDEGGGRFNFPSPPPIFILFVKSGSFEDKGIFAIST